MTTIYKLRVEVSDICNIVMKQNPTVKQLRRFAQRLSEIAATAKEGVERALTESTWDSYRELLKMATIFEYECNEHHTFTIRSMSWDFLIRQAIGYRMKRDAADEGMSRRADRGDAADEGMSRRADRGDSAADPGADEKGAPRGHDRGPDREEIRER